MASREKVFPEKHMRQKRTAFNSLKARVENGWARLNSSGFNFREFKAPAFLFSAMAAIAVILLGWFKGFFNLDFQPLLTSVQGMVYGLVALFLFGESLFYFIFAFGRIKRLDFWKETIWFKAISYVLGFAAIIIAPVTTMIEAFLAIFVINHVFMNYVIKLNYDRYEEFFSPKKRHEEEEEEEQPMPKGVEATINTQTNQPMLLAQPPQTQLTAMGYPICKMDTISAEEMKRIYDAGIVDKCDDIGINIADITKAKEFIKNINWFTG